MMSRFKPLRQDLAGWLELGARRQLRAVFDEREGHFSVLYHSPVILQNRKAVPPAAKELFQVTIF